MKNYKDFAPTALGLAGFAACVFDLIKGLDRSKVR
jgi:hypothetical protein